MEYPKVEFLYLNEEDMVKAGVKDMAGCIEAMEEMFKLMKVGNYRMGGANGNSHGCMVMFPPSSPFPEMPVDGPDRRFMAMPAYLGGKFDMAGMKWYGSNCANKEKGLPRSILMLTLNDKDTGAPVAYMSANILSAYRTGAVPGVGYKHLSRPDSKVAAIIGPGVMSKTALAAIMAVRPGIETVKVKGRGKTSLEKFIAHVKQEYPQAVLLESDSCYFGVRFLPGYNPILGTAHAVHDLVNQRVPFSALIQDEWMFENICATTDFQKQISAFMHSYMKIYRRVSPLENSNLLVLHSANQLFRTAGRVSIESLAEETGYTPRYLDRSFREETGLSPKQLAKIVRFQTAVSALNAPNGRNLTEIAMDLGYYDQSHFVHDFKAFTGLTPKKYEALLRADAYDQKLQILPANIPLYG